MKASERLNRAYQYEHKSAVKIAAYDLVVLLQASSLPEEILQPFVDDVLARKLVAEVPPK
jgi:hypothetical protein